MTKKLLALLLVSLFPATLFAEVRVPKFRSKTRVKHTQTTQPVRGGGITERGPLTGAHAQGPITRGMQQGILRRMEVETSKARIPATRSNPRFEFGRQFREQKELAKVFVDTILNNTLPLSKRIKAGRRDVKYFTSPAKKLWKLKETIPEHEFYFKDLLAVFYFHSPLNAAQLRDIRAFYEKAISHPEVFTSDMAFADALSGCLGISFVGDAYLAEKIFSLAKQAPEGKRFLTDFVVVRSLLNLERYDLVEELMVFREGQEGWFQGEKFVGGETASVYEEVKLYQQTVKNIPVLFSEQLPARSKFTFSEQDKQIRDLMEGRTNAMLFQSYLEGNLEFTRPETSAEDLEWFLQYRHRDFSK